MEQPRRTIRVVVNAQDAESTKELYELIVKMITYWNVGNVDDLGNVTIHMMTTEKHLEVLKAFLRSQRNKEKFGITLSGLVENNVFVGWPRKKNEDPKTFSEMAPLSTLGKKTIRNPIKEFFERIFHFKHSPKG